MTVQDLDRIEAKLDKVTAGAVAVSDSMGGVLFANMAEVMEFAKLMSLSQVAVRKHLRGNPGACLAITVQALEWRMSPFAVANKSYSVNDQIAYESQLIHAVVNARAPLQKRLKHEYTGEGQSRKCKIIGLLKGEVDTSEYESPAIKDIKTKNSPLWTQDPDQQLHYFAVRSWARRHVPEVLLGIYAEDELEGFDRGQQAQDITPKPDIASRLDGGRGKRGFNKAGVDHALEHKPAEVVDVTKSRGEPIPVNNDPELPASLDRRETNSDVPDELSEWLDEQIAVANNLKTSEELDELDPKVWKRLRDANRAKDLGEKWETEGFNPNMNRLDPARKPKK